MTINEKEILRHAAQRADQNFQRCQMSNVALSHPHYHRSAVHHHCWRSHAYLQSLHRPFQAADVLVPELGWNAPSVVEEKLLDKKRGFRSFQTKFSCEHGVFADSVQLFRCISFESQLEF